MAVLIAHARRIIGAALALALAASPVAAAPPCLAPASLAVFVENLSTDAAIEITLEGELADPAATCMGAFESRYTVTFTCTGTGLARCGTVRGLHPGAWINRLAVQVTDSDAQRQAQRMVLLGGPGSEVSNVLTWTVYPRTFVVATATEPALRATLDAAGAYAASAAVLALVTFSPEAFPGAARPQTIELSQRRCSPDGLNAGLCLTGSRLVVDALDARAERGGVVLSAGSRPLKLLRIYGSDMVLRGLVLRGSDDATAAVTQTDTVTFVGPGARRTRLEQCVVHGPANGDAISVEAGAGRPLGSEPADIVIDDCEVSGAQRTGLKVTTGGRATIQRSCIHDNRNGGVVSTLGGHVTALHNLIQHNVPGSAQHGLHAGTPDYDGERSTLVTDGNIVRLNGARGLSVVDHADAAFANDYVADNQFAGARVESTVTGGAPSAVFRGVALTCNHNGAISGTCQPASGDDTYCTSDADCCGAGRGCCAGDPDCPAPARCVLPAPQGFGTVVTQCETCAAPALDFGTTGAPGHNALALNVARYPNAEGVNFEHDAPGVRLRAQGNQWERCGSGATCNVTAVAAGDVRVAAGATLDLGLPPGPRAGTPRLTALSVGRPRAGELVRVFGTNFNAVDGAACTRTPTPVAACSAENPRVAHQNRAHAHGNRVRIAIGDELVAADVEAVTPTMLAFRMPFDCFTPATLQISKRDPDGVRRTGTIGLCDAGGCHGRPANAPCDDDNVCTVGDSCRGADGTCVPGPPRDCGGQCMMCDPIAGCMPRPAGSPCDDGDACTVGDRCRGDADVCVSGAPRVCDGQCHSGACHPLRGCEAAPAGTPCDNGNACTIDDQCRGIGNVCLAGRPTNCDDANPCTRDTCNPADGCRHEPLRDFDAVSCRLARLRAALSSAAEVAPRTARLLDRQLVRLARRTEAAREASRWGYTRRARRLLASVRNGLRAFAGTLPRRRGLPAALGAALAPLAIEGSTEAEFLRSRF